MTGYWDYPTKQAQQNSLYVQDSCTDLLVLSCVLHTLSSQCSNKTACVVNSLQQQDSLQHNSSAYKLSHAFTVQLVFPNVYLC